MSRPHSMPPPRRRSTISIAQLLVCCLLVRMAAAAPVPLEGGCDGTHVSIPRLKCSVYHSMYPSISCARLVPDHFRSCCHCNGSSFQASQAKTLVIHAQHSSNMLLRHRPGGVRPANWISRACRRDLDSINQDVRLVSAMTKISVNTVTMAADISFQCAREQRQCGDKLCCNQTFDWQTCVRWSRPCCDRIDPCPCPSCAHTHAVQRCC